MKYFFLILLSFVLTSCAAKKEKVNFSSVSIPDSQEVNHEYSEISKYRIDWNQIFEINNQSYYVYIFSRTCSHCSEIKNKVIQYALDHKNMYFVEDSESVVIKKDVQYTIGITSIDDLAILGFPSLLSISNKILSKNIAGTEKILSELFDK